MSKKSYYVLYDCETGGLDYSLHPITQIALVAIDNLHLKQYKEYQTFVKPYYDLEITQAALQHSLVDIKTIQAGKDYKQVVKDLIEFFKSLNLTKKKQGKPTLVGHNNQAFDNKFLELLFSLADKNLFDYVQDYSSDTLILAKQCWDLELMGQENVKFTLTECCKRAGINLTNAHSAHNDTLATLQLFIYFIQRLRGGNKASNQKTISIEKKRKTFSF